MAPEKNTLKEAKIFSLILIPLLGQYVVTLEEVKGQRLIPIWIGVNEGNAIGLKLQGEDLPRPMTHDLMSTLLDLFQANMEKIVVTDLKDGTYYAVLQISIGTKKFKVDCRPSDAMALAVRTQSPIFLEEKVLKKCPVIMKPISDQDVDKFKKDLQSLTPEDFFKGLGKKPKDELLPDEEEPDAESGEEGTPS